MTSKEATEPLCGVSDSFAGPQRSVEGRDPRWEPPGADTEGETRSRGPLGWVRESEEPEEDGGRDLPRE